MLIFVDRMTLDAAPRRTADGYLVASPKVARTGIQEYRGAEVGKPDQDIVRVFRPEEEVFATDALHSFGHRPVTIDHPPEMVDAKNWKKYARGTTGGDVVRDGECVVIPMALMDQDAIAEVEDGKRELSMGYTADLDFTPGKTPAGEQYDAVQRNIRGNHLAIVDKARGGSQLRVFDAQPVKPTPTQSELFTMTMKTILVDGITVEVSDTAAQVIAKYTKDMEEEKKSLDEKIKAMEDELASLKAEKAKESETKDAEIATLKKQVEDSKLTPQKLDDAVKARDEVIKAAKKVVANITTDGKTDAEIRRAVVDSAMGDTAKGWSDDQVAASFNTLTNSAKADPYRQQHLQNPPVKDGGTVQHLADYNQRLTDAWKHQKGA